MRLKSLSIVSLAAVLWGCSSTPTKTVEQKSGCEQVAAAYVKDEAPSFSAAEAAIETPPETPVEQLPPMRYLAWMEGDYQNDYQPNRELAEKNLAKFDGKVPEATDTDEYLQYLSALSASGKAEAGSTIKGYLSKHPNEKRAVFLLGVHYMRTKKKELAQYLFAQLEKDTSFPWKSLLYNNLGMMALQDKNRPVAIEYLEKATKSQPPTAAPYVNLGALYLQSRSYLGAEELFRRALDIDDEFEDAALGLGVALEGQGKFQEAHEAYASYLKSNGDGLSVLFNDAVILGNRLKQRDQAAEMMLRYIQRGGKESAKAHESIQSWR